MSYLVKYVYLLAALITLSTAAEAVKIDGKTQSEIEQAVYGEYGYYDAAEIEKRVRQWGIEQPMAAASAGVISSERCGRGGCQPQSSVIDPGGIAPLPTPTELEIIGYNVSGDQYYPHLNIQFNPVDNSNGSRATTVQHYLLNLAYGNSHIDTFLINKPVDGNTQDNLRLILKLRDLPADDYFTQVKTVYLNGSSVWTDPEYFTVVDDLSRVSDLSAPAGFAQDSSETSGLYNCIINNGYSDNMLLKNIQTLNCNALSASIGTIGGSVNLTDFDGLLLPRLYGLRQLTVDFMTDLTSVSVLNLNQLPHLSWFSVRGTNMDTVGLNLSQSIDTLIFKSSSLTQVPALPPRASYVDFSESALFSGSPNLLGYPRKVVKINDNPLNNDFFKDLVQTSSISLNAEILDASTTPLTDISAFGNIDNIKHLNVNDTLLGSTAATQVNIDTFTDGICSLQMDNTSFRELVGFRPIQYLSIKGSPALKKVKTMNNSAGSGEPPLFLLPNYLDLSGSNSMYCGHLYNTISRWNTYEHVNLSSAGTLGCPVYENKDSYNTPTTCLPNALWRLKVYQQEQQVLTWETRAQQELWGVTHYEFEALDANGHVIESFRQNDENALSITNQAVNPAAYRGRICINTVCGAWTTVEQSNFSDALLVAVEDASAQWLGTSSSDRRFTISLSYPLAVFNAAYGKPDYFQISPVNSTTGQTPPSIYVGATHQSQWTSAVLQFDDYQVNSFNIKACSNDIGCGPLVNVSLGLQSGADLNPVVYEDENSARRYVFWDMDPDAQAQGVSYYEIESLVDPNCPAQSNTCNQTITQSFPVGGELPFVAFGLVSDYYKVRACTIDGDCSEWEQATDFENGLARVTDLRHQWTQINGYNQFKLKWNYPDEAFCLTPSNCVTNTARPTFFKMTPIFPQILTIADNNQTIIEVVGDDNFNTIANGTGEVYWSNEWSPSSYFIGNSFSVQACNEDYCGAPANITLGEPVTSDDLPIPQWRYNGPFTVYNTTSFDLEWNASILDHPDVDYIEIRELQPSISSRDLYYDFNLEANPPQDPSLDYNTTIFYSQGESEITLERVVKGRYFFNLRACKRDRDSGDVCSAYSNSKEYRLYRQDDVEPLMPQQVTSVLTPVERTCGNGGTCIVNVMNAEWTYPFNPQVDYFIMEGSWSPGQCGAPTITGPTYHSIVIDASEANTDPETGKWTTRFMCEYVVSGATNPFKVRACNYGTGCGPYSEIVFDPSNPDRERPLEELSQNRNVIGGPGDMNPGLWWNESLTGTGWHFYWASELRYPSVHENYGTTYDLLGMWVTYKIQDGVWTPIWLFSQMKQKSVQSEGCHAGNSVDGLSCRFFEGDLQYVTKSPTTGEMTSIRQGRLQVFFNSTGDNRRATLNLDIDSDNGILTQDNIIAYDEVCDPDCLSFASDGTLNMPITDFNIYLDEEATAAGLSLTQAWGPKNDDDHYSGMWVNNGQYTDDFSIFTHVERDFEWSTVAYFDSQGDPIWAQAQTCYPCASPGPDAGYFQHEYYTVAEGFHPLHYRPNNFNWNSVNVISVGYGGRRFDTGGFNEAEFWIDIDTTFSELPGRGASSSLEVGSANNMEPITKVASFHDIRYFINAYDESEDTCDPNAEGECVVYFTWFTDDDFPGIEPFYSDDNGQNYAPLSEICGNTPIGYVARRFECTFDEAGTYRFQLHKPKYNGSGTVAIAESADLIILPCTSENCEGSNSGEPTAPPAQPPAIADMTGELEADPLNDVVGSTSGAFDVDESGAANYSVPIFAPKGRGGLAPQMALSYNSMAGNGIAGVGWSITGTSSITRCLKSPEHDPNEDFYPSISMTDDDAYCLDGMRLFPVEVAKNGDIYFKTELESYSRIRATGIQGNGPKVFIVESKSGDIRTYGSPGVNFQGGVIFSDGTGGQIRSNEGSNTVHTWLLTQVKDRHENKIRFAWDTKNGENYLIKAYWGGIGGNRHHYQINFNYSAGQRRDATHGYGMGVESKMFRRLESVSTLIREKKTDAAMQEVRRLNLDYQENAQGVPQNTSGRYRLASITECLNANGTCKQPLNFDWDNGRIVNNYFSGTTRTSNNMGRLAEMGIGAGKLIDVNGDGISEFMFVRNYDDGNILFESLESRFHVAYIRNNGDLSSQSCQNLNDTESLYKYVCDVGLEPFELEVDDPDDIKFSESSWFVYDFNDDGYQDIISVINDRSTWQIYYSNGSIICKFNTGSCSGYGPTSTQVPVLYQQQDNLVAVSAQYKNGLISKEEAEEQVLNGLLEDQINEAFFFDITNDGIPEILQLAGNASSNREIIIWSMQKNSQNQLQFVSLPSIQIEDEDLLLPSIGLNDTVSIRKLKPVASDFNGDGYSDLLIDYMITEDDGNPIGICPGLICDYDIRPLTAAFSMKSDVSGGSEIQPLGLIAYDQEYENGSSRSRETRSVDINGDGLTDIAFSGNLDSPTPFAISSVYWYYQLNLGLNEEGGVSFSDIKSFNLEPLNDLRDDYFDPPTDDEHGRQNMVEFIDYDNDGDIDILYPANQSQTNGIVKYKVRKYSVNNPFASAETTSLVAGNTSYDLKESTNIFADINGDGYLDQFRTVRKQNHKQQSITYGKNQWKTRDKITSISSDAGELFTDIDVHYEAAVLPTVYSKSIGTLTSEEFSHIGNGSPVFDLTGPRYLVRKVSRTAPIESNANAKASMYYHYSGVRVQAGGRGWLGYENVTTYDAHHLVKTQTNYRQDFPYIGMAESTQASKLSHLADDSTALSCAINSSFCEIIPSPSTCLISDCTDPIENGASQIILSVSNNFYKSVNFGEPGYVWSRFPYLYKSYEKSFDLNDGSAIKGNVSEFDYDIFHGNVSSTIMRNCKASIGVMNENDTLDSICGTSGQKMVDEKVTINTYADNEDRWLLGRLSSTTVTSKRLVGNSYQSQTRVSGFEYDPVTGQLIEETIGDESDPEIFLRTMHKYDDYGQKLATYQCSSSVSEADCDDESTIVARPYDQADPYYVHRYTRYVYDGDWQEYVEQEFQPFTGGNSPFNASSDTANLENGNYDFGQNQPVEHQMAELLPVNNKTRDIYGNPLRVKGLYDDQVYTVYGAFGEPHASAANTGGMSKTIRRWCLDTNYSTYQCPSLASMITITETVGAPTKRLYHDQLGRELRSQIQNMQGLWMTTDTFYDIMGRTVKQSEPYLRSNNGAVTSLHYTTTTYDALDRVIQIISPAHCVEDLNSVYVPGETVDCVSNGLRTTTTAYDGLSTITTNPNGQSSEQIFDETGKVIRVIDALGSVIDYGYDAQGNLATTTSYKNGTPNINEAITIEMDYDDYGRKIEMRDPDKGRWTYAYNPLGELVSQTDAKLQTTLIYYDVRGRMFYRHEPYSVGLWEYDNVEPGQLSSEVSRGEFSQSRLGDISARSRGQDKAYDYDDFGRPVGVTTALYDGVDGINLSDTNADVYTTSQTYDQHGRAYQSFDATNLGVLVQYNGYGYQTIIRDAANGESGQIYHEVLETDARGQVVHERHHGRFETMKSYDDATGFLQNIQTTSSNGDLVQDLNYAFDAIGNLIRRSDMSPVSVGTSTTQSETFEYDTLNRLKKEYLNYTSSPTATYAYDDTGNLEFKHGMQLEYEDSKPHAVSSASGGGEGSNSYAYDNNGNMYSRTGSKNLTIGYTAFDKADYMIGNDSEGNQWENFIAYDANRSRYLRVDLKSELPMTERTVTHYAGGAEFVYKDLGAGDVKVTAKRYIGNLVIHVDIEEGEPETNRNRWKFNYLLKDHIGSTHTVVNRQGVASAYMSFNAWGQRRKASIPDNNDVYLVYNMGAVWSELGSEIEETTNRGFTGHEHFDQLGIIHMNGRIYDASIGRFLQADPIIQNPYNTQSLNRYSYVMNNPLSYTDPTGYARLRSGWWRVPLAIGITVITSGAASGALFANTAFGGLLSANAFAAITIGGALSGAVATGNLKGALKGAITAAITYGIGHGNGGKQLFESPTMHFTAHAFVSGVSAEVDGGKFGHGFAASFLSQLAHFKFANVFDTGEVGLDIVSNAVLQGSISELTGGKFANGAMSAAFRVAFNHHGKKHSSNVMTQAEAIAEAERRNNAGSSVRIGVRKSRSVVGGYEVGPEKLFMEEAQAFSSLSRTNQVLVERNDINACRVGCMTSSVVAALVVGDATSFAVGGAAELDAGGIVASGAESMFDDFFEDTPIGRLKSDFDRVLLVPNIMNNFNHCMIDCQTTFQDKIFKK